MKTVGNSERIFRYLLNLNSWIVMVLGGVIAKSIRGYIREQSAHEFLKSVTAVPVTPWKTCVLLVLLFFLYGIFTSDTGGEQWLFLLPYRTGTFDWVTYLLPVTV